MCYVPGMISQQDVSIWLWLGINFLNTEDKLWTLTNITTTVSPKSAIPTIVNCNMSTLQLTKTMNGAFFVFQMKTSRFREVA